MERFNKKEKNLQPIESAAKILKDIGMAQFAEAELSDNDKQKKDPAHALSGHKHRGKGLTVSEFEDMKKSKGAGEDELPEGFTPPYEGE